MNLDTDTGFDFWPEPIPCIPIHELLDTHIVGLNPNRPTELNATNIGNWMVARWKIARRRLQDGRLLHESQYRDWDPERSTWIFDIDSGQHISMQHDACPTLIKSRSSSI